VAAASVRVERPSLASPILANIYLDRLDQFIETELLPACNRGGKRKTFVPYMRTWRSMRSAEREGRDDQARTLRRELLHLPSRDPNDPRHRRLRYCRYADDWILGFCGPRQEAEEIKDRIRTFLRDHLKLELSEPKTLITHGRTQSARFLGYDIAVAQAIGDPNPVYRDLAAARQAGYPDVIAPPTFAVVVALPAGIAAARGRFPGTGSPIVVHVDQRFEYTRPIRAGDVLRAESAVTGIRELRGAAMVTIRTDIRPADGEHICSARMTLAELTGHGSSDPPPPAPSASAG
jgi:acyl dehydratase